MRQKPCSFQNFVSYYEVILSCNLSICSCDPLTLLDKLHVPLPLIPLIMTLLNWPHATQLHYRDCIHDHE